MTTLRRSRFVADQFIKPGATLPPRRTWDPTAPGQVVESRERAESGLFRVQLHDLATDERYAASFHPLRGLPCPIERTVEEAEALGGRVGTTNAVDWRRANRLPHAGELQEDDLLPARSTYDDPGADQQVKRVSLNHLSMVQLQLKDHNGVFSPTYELDELVEFPQDMSTFRERRRASRAFSNLDALQREAERATALAALETLGYYHDTRTNTIHRFVRHPFGRGGWPREIPAFSDQRTSPDGGPVISQPPRGPHARFHAVYLRRLSTQETAEVAARWGEPLPIPNLPTGATRNGELANGHAQPRTEPITVTP